MYSPFPKLRMKQNTRLPRYRLCELRKMSVFRCTSTSSCSWLLFLATLVIPDNYEGSVEVYSQVQTTSTIVCHLPRKMAISSLFFI